MPSYKLIYFQARGGAEVTRLVFAAAGQEYVDERIPRDEWPDKKPGKNFIFPCLLTLYINDRLKYRTLMFYLHVNEVSVSDGQP